MAEIKETAFTDSGYRPGRALSPEDYSGGFVDFYKDTKLNKRVSYSTRH